MTARLDQAAENHLAAAQAYLRPHCALNRYVTQTASQLQLSRAAPQTNLPTV